MKHIKTFVIFDSDGINEKMLSRTIKHMQNDEYVVFTAWRSQKSTHENLENMKKLQGLLGTHGFGFIDMHGVGQEHGGKSYEKSIMVVDHDDRPEFKEVMLDMAAKFEQDFILYGIGGVSYLIDVKTGEEIQKYTDVKQGEAEFYSILKGIKADQQQTFHLE